MKRVYLAQFVLLFASCVGCGGPASSVQGTVTIDGQLANQGTVQFHPVEGGPTAYGSIAKDGSYSLRVGQGDLDDPNAGDVPIGEYIVTVVVNMPSSPDVLVGETGPPHPGARLTAAKYGDKQTSDLRQTVKLGRNVVPLELEGISADETTSEPVTPTMAAQATTDAEGNKEQIDAPPVKSSGEDTTTTPSNASPNGETENPASEETSGSSNSPEGDAEVPKDAEATP